MKRFLLSILIVVLSMVASYYIINAVLSADIPMWLKVMLLR